MKKLNLSQKVFCGLQSAVCVFTQPLILCDHFLYSCRLNVQTSSDHVKRNFIFIGA